MDKLLEKKEYILKFYANNSRYIDKALQFVLALLTFVFVNSNIGFMEVASNPVVTIGLSVICTFLPVTLTVVLASLLVVIQIYALAPGAAILVAVLLIVMSILYFRFAMGHAVILLLVPIAFMLKIPVLIPIVCAIISGPVCAIPIAFGTMVYYMVTCVKSSTNVLETLETGVMGQFSTYAKQFFNSQEMWVTLIAFTMCLLIVYNIRRLAIENASEIAVVAGAIVNILTMTLGNLIMDSNMSYIAIIVGSVVAVLLAIVLEKFVLSLDYSRTEYLQFEDDEYYYYVKAVPKLSVAVPEKKIKKIHVRQETATVNQTSNITQEETDIQKLIEEELKN